MSLIDRVYFFIVGSLVYATASHSFTWSHLFAVSAIAVISLGGWHLLKKVIKAYLGNEKNRAKPRGTGK